MSSRNAHLYLASDLSREPIRWENDCVNLAARDTHAADTQRGNTMSPPPSKKRRKPVVIAALSACVTMALLAGAMHWRWRQVMLHVAAVERLGGSVEIEPAAPGWLYRFLPDNAVFPPPSNQFGPDWLRQWLPAGFLLKLVENAGTVRGVSLDEGPGQTLLSDYSGERRDVDHIEITDDDLLHVAAFPGLQTLKLRNMNVSDAGLLHLRNLRQLRNLNLAFTKISDNGLKIVGSFDNLEDLGLAGTAVTDAGIVHLVGLPHLSRVDVRGTSVTARGDKLLSRGGRTTVESKRTDGSSVWIYY